ncbi:MAG: response regulator transcription factor [Chloroflexi bacterium]|nr:response regulator transcription factor [Chloroflexota bacterium]
MRGASCGLDDEPPSSPGALTRREREVVILLSRGYTNRQIAEEMVISSRTADGHVVRILTKLELKNRSQVAMWAVQYGIVRGEYGF